LGVGLFAGALLVPFTNRLPLVAQRAICFLPVKVNPAVRYDAWASTDWRLRMWSVLMDEVPHYIWLGKGYQVNPVDLYLARESQKRGFISDFESAYIAGDYHSGPLSILIPLGIFGLVAFLWTLGAGTYAMYRNYRSGAPEHARLNTFLLAFYVAQVVFYFGVFGAFSNGLFIFTGTVAFSVSLNGGVAQAVRRVTQSSAVPAKAASAVVDEAGPGPAAEGVGAPA
jgi:O-antigen ligase